MTARCGAVLLLLLVAPCALAQPRGPVLKPRQVLGKAIDLYMEGRYKAAAALLRPLVQTRVLRDHADQKEALRAYGICLYLSGARAGAERAFRDLLRLSPNERLDPNFVRPEVVAFLEYVRKRYQAELSIKVRRKATRAWVNIIPPWGQFQNGHKTKGYLLLSGELAFCTASVVTFAVMKSWEGDTGEFKGHEDQFEPMRIANIVTFSACMAQLVYGVVDGLYYYYRSPLKPSTDQVGVSNLSSLPPLTPAMVRF